MAEKQKGDGVQVVQLPNGSYLVSFDADQELTSSDTVDVVAEISDQGSVAFGYQGTVDESVKIAFAGYWTGDALVTGSGDAEKVSFQSGDYLEMIDAWNLATSGETKVDLGKYEGIIGTLTVKYRTGATQASAEAATYTTAAGGLFTCDGWFQIKLES